MKVTVDVVMDLHPCYSRSEVRKILGRNRNLVDVLMSIPPHDMRWFVSSILTAENREHWAYACADRAAAYAYDAHADATASASAAASAAETRLQIEHAVTLIKEQ